MVKKQVDVFDYAGEICKAMKSGILLTTALDGKVNTMTIGWGTLGIEWNKPIFIAYVRESRFTREFLDQSGEFTVNIPVTDDQTDVIRFCGRKSGRDTDKIQEMSLSLVESDTISAPGIKEFPLTLECKVINRQLQTIDMLPTGVQDRFYPGDVETGNWDIHIAYYGEILNVYLIEDSESKQTF